MEKKGKLAVVIVVWLLCGLLMTPLIQGKRPPTSLWIPHPEFLAIVAVLTVGVVFIGRTLDWFHRYIAGVAILFHALPTLAFMFEPTLYWMVVPAGIFLLLCLPWNPILFLPWMGFYFIDPVIARIPLPLPVRSLATSLLLSGTGIFIVSLVQLLHGGGRLVSTGVYALVRHPQYLGIALATLGLTFMGEWLILLSVLSWMTLVFAYVFLAHREEQILQKRFSVQYPTYTRRVPFMVPFLPSGKLSTLFPSHGLTRYLRLWALLTGCVIIFWIIAFL